MFPTIENLTLGIGKLIAGRNLFRSNALSLGVTASGPDEKLGFETSAVGVEQEKDRRGLAQMLGVDGRSHVAKGGIQHTNDAFKSAETKLAGKILETEIIVVGGIDARGIVIKEEKKDQDGEIKIGGTDLLVLRPTGVIEDADSDDSS